MKKIIWAISISHFALCLWASDRFFLEQQAMNGDALSAFIVAGQYEEEGKAELALSWYKKASELALGKVARKNELTEGILKEKAAKIERTQEVYGSILSTYENDPKTYDSMKQMMTKVFDIAPYKSNYLLPMTYDNVSHADNREHAETKFQISFQKSLIDNLLGFHETFALAYTQTSWWQTTRSSTPFKETNYQPELLVVMPHFEKDSAIKAYQFGLLHESNGQDVPKSRSWNRVYAKTYLQLGNLIVAPRLWYRLPEDAQDDDNPNIEDYLGYGDLEFTYPWGQNTFKILARHNMHFNDTSRGALQFDWTFPLWDKNLFGYIQLFSGYGESLIDYNERSDRIGIGFALSR